MIAENPLIPWHRIAYKVRMRRIINHVEAAIMRSGPLEVYALTGVPTFWYKALLCTPQGALWTDTGGDSAHSLKDARDVVRRYQRKTYPFCLTTLDALMENWQHYGLYPNTPRAVASAIFRFWAQHT